MRVLIDTNILVSATLFLSGRISEFLKQLLLNFKICICSYSVEELQRVTKKKFPHKQLEIDEFLRNLSYELIYTLTVLDKNIPIIRDIKDEPILATAIYDGIDILISGDKDFTSLKSERLQIFSPKDFALKYF